jgi:hypothetical protein
MEEVVTVNDVFHRDESSQKAKKDPVATIIASWENGEKFGPPLQNEFRAVLRDLALFVQTLRGCA